MTWLFKPFFLIRSGGAASCVRPLLAAGLLALLAVTAGCARSQWENRYDYDNIVSRINIQTPAPAQQTLPAAKDLGKITLADAIKTALENNPDTDMALARIRQSEAMIDQAKAAYWPVLSLYGSYSQGDAPSGYLFSTIDQRLLPPNTNFNDPGWFENYEIGAKVGVNLFNGGRDWLNRHMAETGLAISQLDSRAVNNGLAASVISAWYDCLAAGDFIAIAEESVSTVEAELRLMQVRYDAGGVLKSDVLSLDVRLAQAKEELVRAQSNRSLALAALANLMGLNPDAQFELDAQAAMNPDLPPDYSAGSILALAKRPELKQARLAVIKSAMGVDMAKSHYLPTADAQLKYYMDDPDASFDSDRDNWTAGVIINWNAFTGGRTSSAVRQAKNVQDEMLAADRKAAQNVLLDVKTAYLNLDSARARNLVAAAAVEQARESLRLVKKQYEGGSVTVTRYLDAELAFNSARIRSSSAVFDSEKAAASVGRALGLWASLEGESNE
ncbi:outer membrane efflux protein [Desulfatibacillum aliphaticivorans]|uniref:Outer membrane efflux protein n=1 Tax=Desulfatibacillum aliphaticivorans TaxID=218208 RepID=B8FAV2_DESAL|nr:TolC family protein [Desulfatibacillum aliphaticivorans]ACL04038.1 outer membrane efflux protein [Desulfatibacillum aliphaticivorans]